MTSHDDSTHAAADGVPIDADVDAGDAAIDPDIGDERPVIGITMGDPAGIGPEIIVAALARPEVRRRARFIVFGVQAPLHHAAEVLGLPDDVLPWSSVISAKAWDEHPHEALEMAGGFNPVDAAAERPAGPLSGGVLIVDHTMSGRHTRPVPVGSLRRQGERWATRGEPSVLGGALSMSFLTRAIVGAWPAASETLHLIGLDDVPEAMRQPHPYSGNEPPLAPPVLDAVVTAPIAKASWRLAGVDRFPGHTELFAMATQSSDVAMMFIAPRLRVVLATIHEPLHAVPRLIQPDLILCRLRLTHDALVRDFGIERPRIAVCGLNPHASEGGIFGLEESQAITPGIEMARAQPYSIDASGPWPGDTVFNAAIAGRFDAVLAMYHDQGTIPVKLLARDEGVNMTIGLPIIRTSPDHGTAFDIAGRGIADPGSMLASIRLAIDLAIARRRRDDADSV